MEKRTYCNPLSVADVQSGLWLDADLVEDEVISQFQAITGVD